MVKLTAGSLTSTFHPDPKHLCLTEVLHRLQSAITARLTATAATSAATASASATVASGAKRARQEPVNGEARENGAARVAYGLVVFAGGWPIDA